MAARDKETPLVEVITDAGDFAEAFRCASEAFGRQANDAIWAAFNPGWDTPEGQAAGAARWAQRWRAATSGGDGDGDPHTVFLKATLPDTAAPAPPPRLIVGLAIWVQASAVAGRGVVGSDDLRGTMDLDALHPGDEAEQRFLRQMFRSLISQRMAFVRARAAADPPAVMALDLCATHPAFQRRGVATALVQWGLDEARRRGIPEAVMEASSMGRHVYKHLGFQPQGPDMVYEVDDEFAGRDKPPNVFMVYSRDSS
ncbi:acyl-CoA N-acyltransferase [Xylaria palmicola]|nr:acyl-CoA N-acyltransferase [Xylaria palmicola]